MEGRRGVGGVGRGWGPPLLTWSVASGPTEHIGWTRRKGAEQDVQSIHPALRGPEHPCSSLSRLLCASLLLLLFLLKLLIHQSGSSARVTSLQIGCLFSISY